MTVEISSALIAQLCAAAAASPDAECCGLLFGDDACIARAEDCANVAANPARTFEIDPAAHFAALRAGRTGGPRLIGYWHSHPNGDVRPSATDTAQAAPDGKLWLIASNTDIGLWRAEAGAAGTVFTSVPLCDGG